MTDSLAPLPAPVADPQLVPSPCIAVCRMDQAFAGSADGLCSGCLRTLDEIIAWAESSDEDKKEVWRRIALRRQTLDKEHG